MELLAYPEAYINSTTTTKINKTNKAILSPEILKKYQKEILNNKDGCIFKLTYYNPTFECTSEAYVSCIEFSAPKDSCFLPNTIFDSLLMDLHQPAVISLEIFSPPQATFVKFEIMNTLLDMIPDIKNALEKLLTSNYKFIYKGQTISFIDHQIKVIELEPFDICLINNTDIEVEFDVMKKISKKHIDINQIIKGNTLVNNFLENQEEEVPVNNIDENIEDVSDVKQLSPSELRLKRLAYFSKK
jgi:hypothetical protein